MNLASNRMRLAVLTLMHFLVDFYGGIRSPLPQPTLTEHYSVTFGEALMGVTLSIFVANLIQPLCGGLLPKRGFPIFLVVGPIVSAFVVGIGLTQVFGIGVALMVISCIGIGLVHPEGMLAAHAVSGDRQGLGIAIYLSGGFFGYSVGSLVAGEWAAAWKLEDFWLLSIPAVLVVGLIVLTRLHRMQDHVEMAAPKRICHRIPFSATLLLAALVAIVVTGVALMITPLVVRRFGEIESPWGGRSIFAFGMAGAIGGYLWGHLSERGGRCRIIAICTAAGMPSLYMLISIERPEAGPLWCALGGFFLAGTFPVAAVLGRGAAKGATRLAAGLMIGGTWGLSSLFFTAASPYIDTFAEDDPTPMVQVFYGLLVIAGLTVLSALVLSRWERPVEPDAAPE